MKKWILYERLTLNDVADHPVWEYVNDEAKAPETAVRPVEQLPVKHLAGRFVGTRVRLHNGSYQWAMLSNISLGNLRLTKHFLCVGIEKDGRWFELARYHDVDFERRSPTELAKFLGLLVSEVFPIEYDISQFAIGLPAILRGTIPETPEERLSKDELLKLALEDTQ